MLSSQNLEIDTESRDCHRRGGGESLIKDVKSKANSLSSQNSV